MVTIINQTKRGLTQKIAKDKFLAIRGSSRFWLLQEPPQDQVLTLNIFATMLTSDRTALAYDKQQKELIKELAAQKKLPPYTHFGMRNYKREIFVKAEWLCKCLANRVKLSEGNICPLKWSEIHDNGLTRKRRKNRGTVRHSHSAAFSGIPRATICDLRSC